MARIRVNGVEVSNRGKALRMIKIEKLQSETAELKAKVSVESSGSVATILII